MSTFTSTLPDECLDKAFRILQENLKAPKKQGWLKAALSLYSLIHLQSVAEYVKSYRQADKRFWHDLRSPKKEWERLPLLSLRMKQGEIWYANLNPTWRDSEQSGERPSVILSG